MSGNDIQNNSSTGPIKVVVRQDGIGRTGAIVMAIFVGLALGVSGCSLGIMFTRDDGRDKKMAEVKDELKNTQTEYRVLLNHYMELQADVKAGKEKGK